MVVALSRMGQVGLFTGIPNSSYYSLRRIVLGFVFFFPRIDLSGEDRVPVYSFVAFFLIFLL